jgi:hypothetical protein
LGAGHHVAAAGVAAAQQVHRGAVLLALHHAVAAGAAAAHRVLLRGAVLLALHHVAAAGAAAAQQVLRGAVLLALQHVVAAGAAAAQQVGEDGVKVRERAKQRAAQHAELMGASDSPGSMVGAGALGLLGVQRIARKPANLCRASRNKKAPDGQLQRARA